MDPEIDELRQREEQGGKQTQTGDGDDPVADAVDNSGSSGGMLSGVSLGLTRRQLLLIALLVALALAWKMRSGSDGGSSGSSSKDAVESLKSEDLAGEVSVKGDEEAEEARMELRVPTDPDDELDKDRAVVDYMRESGLIGGD